MKLTVLDIIKYFIKVIVIVLTVILIMILVDFTRNKKWNDSIENPDNSAFIVEVAFNHEIAIDLVTQDMFNERYIN